MVKTLTAAAAARYSGTEDVEPLCVLEVVWPSPVGVEYYGDKTFTFATVTVQGRILELSPINALVGQDRSGSVSSATVVLSDHDMALHTKLQTAPLAEAAVRVLLHEPNLGIADVVELMRGKVAQPVWSEEDRTLRFEVVSSVTSNKVGFTPTSDDIADLVSDGSETPWPLVFGKVVDVPAVLVTRGPRTYLAEDIDSDDMSFDVEDADGFSSGAITLKVDGELIKGSFSGVTFTATQRNAVKYSNILSEARPAGHADENNPFVLWLGSENADVVGYTFSTTDTPGYGLASQKKRTNFCVAQKGKRCVFEKPWTRNDKDIWLVDGNRAFTVKRFDAEWIDGNQGFANAGNWTLKAGAVVTEYGNENETWVCSEIPATTVKRVRAFRNIQRNVAGLEQRRLVSVPEDYYIVNLSNASLVSGKTPCTIKFPIGLSQLNQGWEDDQIFVSLESTEGSDTSDIIAYVLNNYSSVTPDATSFAQASTDLFKYPSDCAIQGGPDAIEVCHDIAWQARCALTIIGATATLRYLSKEPGGPDDLTLTSDNVREGSVVLEESSADDVYTVITSQWMKLLSEPWTRVDPRKVSHNSNVTIFGKRELLRDIWIYRKWGLVVKTLDFWLTRYSFIWRQLRVSGFLSALSAEPWDVVRAYLPDVFSPAPVDGWVQEVQHSSDPYGVAVLLWTPVVAGSSVATSAAYTDDTGDTYPTNPYSKVSAGKKEMAKITPFQFALASEPLQSVVAAKVVKVLSSTEYTIELYPRGLAYSPSGTAFMRLIGSPTPLPTVGSTGVAWRTGAGFYMSDVFAS